jgi:hypothetical protein
VTPDLLSSARTRAAWPACVLPLPCRLLETKLSLQLEDLPKATAVIDALRARLSTLRDTVVDGSRNFWVHLAGITSQSAEARRCSNHRTARNNGRFHAASCAACSVSCPHWFVSIILFVLRCDTNARSHARWPLRRA